MSPNGPPPLLVVAVHRKRFPARRATFIGAGVVGAAVPPPPLLVDHGPAMLGSVIEPLQGNPRP